MLFLIMINQIAYSIYTEKYTIVWLDGGLSIFTLFDLISDHD